MNYPMYSNGPMVINELQNMRDRIDRQMQQIQQQQIQQQSQPIAQPITQNFQITPQTNNNELESKFVDNIDDVKKTFVMKTGVFINKDFSSLWIKDVSGNIRTFKTEEIIELDEKDKEIYMLKKQIEEMKQNQEMKGDVVNATERINSVANETASSQKPSKFSNNKRPNAK